jgi:hypothetical protein
MSLFLGETGRGLEFDLNIYIYIYIYGNPQMSMQLGQKGKKVGI